MICSNDPSVSRCGSFYDGSDVRIPDSDVFRRRLVKRRYLTEFEKGDRIANPGDTIDTCYFIDSGSVIEYEVLGNRRRIYEIFRPDTLLFQTYALYQRPCSFYYEAREHCMLYSITLDKVSQLMVTSRAFLMSCTVQTTRELMVTKDLLRKTANRSASWLIADLILILASRESHMENGLLCLNARYTQQEIADMLALNRVTCLRELHRLEDLELIRLLSGRIALTNPEGLAAYRCSTCER